MKKLLFLIVFAAISSGSFAKESYEAWWQKANAFYEQKQYDSAASYFEQIAALKPQEALVYYNLGNTYYRLNQIGPAVLNYERALQVDPSFQEAKNNLSLAQSRIGNRIQSAPEIFFMQWWGSITHGSNSGMWAMISLVLFVLIIGLLLARRFGKIAVFPSQVTGALAFLWIIFLVFAFISANNRINSKKAVVMQNDAPLLNDPGQGKAQSLVPEGTTLKWQNDVDGWVKVRLPDGRTGWMQQSLLARI